MHDLLTFLDREGSLDVELVDDVKACVEIDVGHIHARCDLRCE